MEPNRVVYKLPATPTPAPRRRVLGGRHDRPALPLRRQRQQEGLPPALQQHQVPGHVKREPVTAEPKGMAARLQTNGGMSSECIRATPHACV